MRMRPVDGSGDVLPVLSAADMATEADAVAILAVSEDVTERYTQGRGAFLRLGQLILRLFAALL